MQQESNCQTNEESFQMEVNPGRILVILYDGAIKYLAKAKTEIGIGNTATKGQYLRKAHAIISQLNEALDHSQAPELCSNLEQIYGFMLTQINFANSSMDADPLDPIISQLTELRDAWFQAVSQTITEPVQTVA